MARYIDVEGYRKLFDEEYKKTRKLISEGETHLDNLAEGFSEASRVIDRMSTADVAPKSEVERLKHILNCYALQYGTVKDQHEVIDKAKTDVAREIFMDIDRVVEKYSMGDIEYPAFLNIIAELKKKYTEGEG